jgi:hypothetical protein
MTSVTALEGGMMTGLVRERVAFTVTARELDVAFFSWKKVPPPDVAVDAGSVRLEKPEFVM